MALRWRLFLAQFKRVERRGFALLGALGIISPAQSGAALVGMGMAVRVSLLWVFTKVVLLLSSERRSPCFETSVGVAFFSGQVFHLI